MADRVIQRNDTAARWQSVNPILATGEIGIEIDGAKGYKIGDGKTRWNDLPYPGNPASVVQDTGNNENAVMSQKAVTEKLSELGYRLNNCLYNNSFVFNSSKNNESKLKLIKGKKYRIYFLTNLWNVSDVEEPLATAYIDRFLNGSNVGNVFIRRKEDSELPEYIEFIAEENDYYLVGFRGNQDEKVAYFIDFEPLETLEQRTQSLEKLIFEETGRQLIIEVPDNTIPSGGWHYISTKCLLKANQAYTLRIQLAKTCTGGAVQLYDISGNLLFKAYELNGTDIKLSLTPTEDWNILKSRISLNVQDENAYFDYAIYRYNEQVLTRDIVKENRNLIEGATNRRYVFIDYLTVPSGGWHNNTANVTLKAGVNYNFTGYFDKDLLYSYFWLMDSTGQTKLCEITHSGYQAEKTFVLSEDVTNPIIRVSLNSSLGDGDPIEITASISVNTEGQSSELESESDLYKFQHLYADFETFNSAVNGAFLEKSLNADRIDGTPSNIFGVHESNIYIYKDKIYLIYASNKIDSSENHTKYNIELTRLALDGTVESSQPVASTGDIICGTEVTGCQAPFILGIGGNIHIYCDFHVSGGLQIFHTVYNISQDSFSEWEEVSYINELNTEVTAINPNEQYICSSWFAYSDYSYCTAVFFNQKNCGIAYTQDFKTFNFISRISVPLMGAGGEITSQYSQRINKIIVAYRTIHHCPYLIMRQYDVENLTWEDERLIPDSTARPMMFTYNNNIYLANNAPYSRKNVTIWRTMPDAAWSYWGLVEALEVAKLPYECTYFSFCVYNNEIYMASIQQGLTKIAVSKIPLEQVSKTEINNKLIDLFSQP